MRAVCYHGTGKMQVDNVPDPEIKADTDVILKVSSTAICGSDLHIYDGFMPAMKHGDIIGHEFMGEVVDVGSGVSKLKKGDRVVIPFNIACGHCLWCEHEQYSLCDNSNRDAEKLEPLYGQAGGGLFGYSHLFGGYDGGQAEYVRVPFADSTHLKVPSHIPDDKLLFLTDIFPTGFQAADNANIEKGGTVAVWGCGPVGLFSILSAFLLGAERVFAIDDVLERLEMARGLGAEPINMAEVTVYDELRDRTGGLMPESCIDAVGLEAHGAHIITAIYDRVKTNLMLETDRAHALRQAIMCCRKGGALSIAGVYAGLIDKMPMGAAFGKGLEFRMGQTHVLKYIPDLLKRIEEEEVDPAFLITHRGTLEDAPEFYRTFRDKKDDCIKCVMTP